MRPRDPRRLLPRRRRPPRAQVRILREQPGWSYSYQGSVTTMQAAEATMAHGELERIWNPEHLERLARTYWAFLTKISLGLLRVQYGRGWRAIVLIRRPLVLLQFHAPEYELEGDRGTVTWRIDRGLLVAPGGRGKGFLRLTVKRLPDEDEKARVSVVSEVASFYPALAGWGRLAQVGRLFYGLTQLQVHIVVTHAFLRSLGDLQLAPSVVGMLRGQLGMAEAIARDTGAREGEPAAGEVRPGGEVKPLEDEDAARPAA